MRKELQEQRAYENALKNRQRVINNNTRNNAASKAGEQGMVIRIIQQVRFIIHTNHKEMSYQKVLD